MAARAPSTGAQCPISWPGEWRQPGGDPVLAYEPVGKVDLRPDEGTHIRSGNVGTGTAVRLNLLTMVRVIRLCEASSFGMCQ